MSHIIAVASSRDNHVRLILSQGTTPMVVIAFKDASSLTIDGDDILASAQATQDAKRLQLKRSDIDLTDPRLFGSDFAANILSVTATTSSGAAAIYLMVILAGWIDQMDPKVASAMTVMVSADEISGEITDPTALAQQLNYHLTPSPWPTFIPVEP